MSLHAFVDETKERHLTVVAAVASHQDLPACRAVLHEQRMKGQRRIHFTNERDSRRRKVISEIVQLPVRVYVYDCTSITRQKRARHIALTALTRDLIRLRAQVLILEQDDSLIEADRRTLFHATRQNSGLVYRHEKPAHEPMLWISDAVAWCWQRGGTWRKSVDPVIAEIIRL